MMFYLNFKIIFLFVTFFLFFFLKKKEIKVCILRMLKESKKKQVRSYHENPRVTHSVRSDFGIYRFICANISTKMLAHASHFRVV